MIGSWGPIVFTMSSLRKFSFSGGSREVKYRWGQTEVVNGKARLQFGGEELEGFEIDLFLSVDIGLNPRREIEFIKRIADQGEAYPLIIGGQPLGKNMFVVAALPQEWTRIAGNGKVLELHGSISFLEFVD